MKNLLCAGHGAIADLILKITQPDSSLSGLSGFACLPGTPSLSFTSTSLFPRLHGTR